MIVFNLFRGKKAYTYMQRTKTVEKHNPISGHRWAEHIPLPNTWDIYSPLVGLIETVKSEEKAQSLVKQYGEVDVYLPLTERELEKLRPELEAI